MSTTFKTLYDNVCAMLKDTSTGTTGRVKVAINQSIKELCQVRDWTFLADIDNGVVGTNARSYSLSSYSDKDKILMCRIASQVTIGDSTSQYDVTNPGGTTFTYTWDGNGTNPKIGLGYQQVGDLITTTGFANAGNNVTNSVITAVATNAVSITNATPGVVATDQKNVIVKMTENDNAIPIRRRNRLTVAQLTTYNSVGTLLTQPSRYCEPNNTSIQFDVALATSQAAFIDYKKLVSDLSGDSDACVVPDSWCYIVEQLAFARVLEIDDDSRAKSARDKALDQISLMIKQCPFYDAMFDVDDCMEAGGFLDR